MIDDTVVVTGGGSGIGRAVALGCATRGYGVGVLDIDRAAAVRVAAEIQAAGARAVAVECDVSLEDSVRDGFGVVDSELGIATRVFANAGIETNAPLHEFSADDWRRVIDVNLFGVFLTCRESFRRLVHAGRSGSVVCTSSPAAFVGFAGGGNSAYAASKGGISAFVRSAAIDYAHHGIRVNAVVPGATNTSHLAAATPPGADAVDVDARLTESARTQIPLGRLAHPDEIAAAVLWLFSNDSSYVTGSQLVCDGGLMAKSANDF